MTPTYRLQDMNARAKAWVALACVAFATGCVTNERKPSAAAHGISAEVQYRPAIDSTPAYVPINFPPVTYGTNELPLGKESGLFPIAEIYLTNHRNGPVTFGKVRLDGNELKALPNDKVIWFQFYPSATMQTGETVVLQACLVRNPQSPLALDIEIEGGGHVAVKVPTFMRPDYQIIGVNFSWDMKKAFIAYLPSRAAADDARSTAAPRSLAINGKDCSRAFQIMARPAGTQPGMISVELPKAFLAGEPVHVRMTFGRHNAAQCLLRATKGITLDAYGVDEKDEKLRKELGLNLLPGFRCLPEDVACEERAHGATASSLIEQRQKANEARDSRLTSMFLCVMARPQIAYSIYGQCMDALQINPYRLQYSGRDKDPKFIEKEENFFRWAWLAARPRPWLWAPEASLFPKRKLDRMIEPEELRLLTYAALGHGAKGINYFAYGNLAGEYKGFQESPGLLAEIKKLNAEIRILEPILSQALPISIETVGNASDGVRVYTLWCGDGSELLIVRNLAYTTDRSANELGKKSRFSLSKKELTVPVRKPAWLKRYVVVNPLDGDKIIPSREAGNSIVLELSVETVVLAHVKEAVPVVH